MKKLMPFILYVSLIIFMLSCAHVNVPPGPVFWQKGYKDGYQSGEAAAGYVYAKFKKNFEFYKGNGDYKMGWDDGFQAGKGHHESIQRMLGPAF